MTLAELLGALVAPDHFEGGDLLPLDVVFHTEEEDVELLSVYYSREDGRIHVDIGNE